MRSIGTLLDVTYGNKKVKITLTFKYRVAATAEKAGNLYI